MVKSLLQKLHEDKRGETIVEVLLATVILSIVIAGAYTLTNRAVRIGQSSIERTEAVNQIEGTSEYVRAISQERGDAWTKILEDTDILTSNKPDYSDALECSPPTGNHFYLDIENVSDPQDADIVQAGVRPEGAQSFYTHWIEGYDQRQDGYVDFHVRTCWPGIGGDTVNRATTVVRVFTGGDN